MPNLTAVQRECIRELARAHLAVLAAERALISARDERSAAERLITANGINRKLHQPVTVNVEHGEPLVTIQCTVDTFEYHTSEAI